MSGGPDEPTPLRRSIVAGVKWGSFSAALLFAIGLVQTALLARLLDPADFGLMAATLVVIGLARAFADLGLSSAIVAKQLRDRDVLSSLYWASILAGLVVGAIVLLSVPLVTRFYDQPELTPLLGLTALSFVIIPIGQQFQMLLQMDLAVERLVKIDITGALVGFPVAVTAALAGAGAVSLALGFVTRLAVTAGLLAAWGWRKWRPQWRFRRSDLRGYMSFGLYQMGERSVNYLASNADYILIGRYLGVAPLGAYSVAYQLVVKPVYELNPILTRVAFPAFAQKQTDHEALRRGYVEVIRLIGFLIIPTMVALAVVAPLFIPVVFGDQWDESIRLLQILTIVGITRSLTSPVGDLVLALGRPDLTFKANTFVLITTVAAVAFAVQYGIVAVAVAFAAANVVDYLLFYVLVHRIIGLEHRRYWAALRWPVINSAAIAGAMIGTRLALDAHLGDAMLLVVTLGVGMAAYALLAGTWERAYLRRLFGMLRRAPATSST